MTEPLLVIMLNQDADGPDAGLPPLPPQQVAALHQAILLDSLALARELADATATAVAISPSDDRQRITDKVGPDVAIYLVDNPDASSRLAQALTHAFDEGHSPVIVITTQHAPGPPPERIGQALSWFLQADVPPDVVIGPRWGDGIYLVGMAHPHPEIFAGTTWNANEALSQLLENIDRAGLTVQQLHRWYQIQSSADLQHLHAELDTLPDHLVNLRRFLEEFDLS